MHFAKSQKLTISAIAVLTLVSVFVAFFQTPQQAVNKPVATMSHFAQYEICDIVELPG